MPVGNILAATSLVIALAGALFALLAWIGMEWSRRKEVRRTKRRVTRVDFAARYLLRWTWFDYYMCFVFLFGFIFLISDVIDVAKQQDLYPSWHYGYVLVGIVVLLHAFIYFIARFIFLLRCTEKDRRKQTVE